MQFTIQQQLIRKLARTIAEEKIIPRAAEIDETNEFPEEIFKALADAGMFGLKIPEAYGGVGADTLSYVIAEEEVARGAGVAGVYLSSPNSLSGYPIVTAGTPEQKEKYLPGMVRGDYFICFALTEPNAGSDASGLSCVAKKIDGGYLLNGRKCFITGSTFAKYAIVLAKTAPEKGLKGISAFIVDLNLEGVTRGPAENKMGLHGCGTGDLIFKNVFLPADCLLGREDYGYNLAMNTLNLGRLGVAAQALGIAQRAIELAVSFANERKQFGKTISKFQSIAFMLADMDTKLNAARLLTYDAASTVDSGQDATKLAAMAKYYAAEAAVEIVNSALQIHGGYGYINGFDIERLYRDVRVLPIYEGTSQIQQLIISKYVVE